MARSARQLKERARRAEQREDWSRAIELYGEALRLTEASGKLSLDVSLHNRIGDLHRRQGDVERAVHHYMKAVDHYAEEGLHTGAIALCNKVQRLAPDRVEVYRKLGRLHAATGLLAEARSSFERFLSEKEAAGDPEACRDARLELARLVGDREMLFEVTARMAEAGGEERERALEALRELRDEADSEDRREAILRRIRAMDPDAEPSGEARPGGGAAASPPEDADGGPAPGDRDEPESAAGDVEAEVAEAADVEAEPAGAEVEPVPPAAGEAGARPPAGDDSEPAPGERGRVDLGERIRRRLEAERDAPGRDADEPPPEHDFDDMLVGFRIQSDGAEGEADPAEHLELGVALRQMGLLDDAIREFQAAARAPGPPVRAFELLGEAFIEKDLHGVAARVLTRALHLPGRSEGELLGVLYQLGIAHQAEGSREQALDCFERVYSIDIDFRDVAERMEAVRTEL